MSPQNAHQQANETERRARARAALMANFDVATARGDALLPLQKEFSLSAVAIAEVLFDAFVSSGKSAAPGSIVQRLMDGDSEGSFAYAAAFPYEPDREAPVLDVTSVKIGDVDVPRLGLGCMRLLSSSGVVDGVAQTAIGIARSPESVRHALKTAVDVCGVRYLDVARGYGPWPGFAERVLVDWLGDDERNVMLASKVGYDRDPAGTWLVDLDGEFLAREVEESIAQFNGVVPLLYLVARSTPTTPVKRRPADIAHTLRPLLDAQAAGKIRHIGVANVTLDELKAFSDIAEIAAVQNRFNLGSYADPNERAVLDHCAERGIPFVAWGIFGEGALDAERPPAFSETARDLAITDEQLTISLLLSTAENVVALPGPGRRATMYGCVEGANVKLANAARDHLLRVLS